VLERGRREVVVRRWKVCTLERWAYRSLGNWRLERTVGDVSCEEVTAGAGPELANRHSRRR
jgi:hypothetical protein